MGVEDGYYAKISDFMWKALHGILPSCLNLISRYVNVDPECKRCGDPIESTEHALRDYPGLVGGLELASVWHHNWAESLSIGRVDLDGDGEPGSRLEAKIRLRSLGHLVCSE